MFNTIPCNPFPPSSSDMNVGGGETTGVVYSDTPVVLGKWIDGADVKMRVYSFDTTFEVSNSSWTSTGLTLANAKILKCFGVTDDNTCFPLLGHIDTNGVISLLCGRTSYGATVDDLIIEYVESEG